MYRRIKEIRRAVGLNQIEFAKRLGLSQSTLAMIEVGRRSFGDKHVKLICSEFHVNEKWLRTGAGEMFVTTCYDREFIDVFEQLRPETQKLLVTIAKELLETQAKLLQKK
ncbi:MAG: helix-turn-helix transcriptional regulator [Christensenella sp.]|uniref:helix-turn-helix domain-containing protein n=1 Tax=Christensenella sp. TaxID=1935934 RepID=UPI002B21FE0F|nr:helix-turn-helix transcriptional regulator [Christensenella sp.]MEA5002645.1 helix-turn-helix transcriptional regulator [Christensenella sp.]